MFSTMSGLRAMLRKRVFAFVHTCMYIYNQLSYTKLFEKVSQSFIFAVNVTNVLFQL